MSRKIKLSLTFEADTLEEIAEAIATYYDEFCRQGAKISESSSLETEGWSYEARTEEK